MIDYMVVCCLVPMAVYFMCVCIMFSNVLVMYVSCRFRR